MIERPPVLNYAPPPRKSLKTAWSLWLIVFGSLVLIGLLVLVNV